MLFLPFLRKGQWWVLVLLLMPWVVRGQLNPAAFNLASGNYSFTDWPSNSPAGTYPAGVFFHTCNTANPVLSTATSGDYTAAYNLSIGPRISGLGINGFYFANTLSDIPSIGGAVLSLNTVGRTNINVNFESATHLAGNPANLRLQYRTSIYAPWTDVPGPVEFVSNGTTSVTPSTLTANISALTSGAVDNRPGLQLRWKFYYVSGSSSSSAAIRLDEINVTSTAINNNYIATGQVTNAIFCLTPTVGVSVSIPFNYGPLSVFSAGITFSAQLSDASGSFASPVILGTVISDGSGNQTINTSLPANTASGTGYRVRIISSSPAVIGTNNSSDITIKLSPSDVTSAIVYAGGQRATLFWGSPTSCFDEFMVIGRSGTNHGGTPTGDGSAFTANALFGQGTPFGGGYVVYKGTGYSVAVTGLMGDTSYYFTVWARYQNDWIGTNILIVTPPYIDPNVYVSRRILEAEYFWNNDPGQGNAVPLIALDGNLNSALENLFVNGLQAPHKGASTFSVRIKNQLGNWGPLFSTVINVDSTVVAQLGNLRRITQAEYFWNTDPGAGNGSTLIAFDGSLNQALEQLLKSGISAPRKGPNNFSVRVKDHDNIWGPSFTTVINVDSVDVMTTYTLRKVIQAEYFWNTDPGAGNAVMLLAMDGNLNQAIETLMQSGLQVPKKGQSTFNIRVKDRDNNWGPAFTTVINVDSVDLMTNYTLRKVTQAEYYWNTDPGPGNGSALLALDGNINQAIETLIISGLQAPKNGQNVFSIRVKDRNNSWGPSFNTIVNVDSLDIMTNYTIRKVTQGEFFWNTDPGQGNGTALIAFDGSMNQALEQALKQGVSIPKKGQNLLAIRVKDRDNNWGPDFKTIVNIDSIDVNLSFTRKRIRRVEYFFDQDPGAGNGTLMTFNDGYGDAPLEQAFKNDIALLPNGVHLVGVRAQDRDNNWGPVYKTTISIDTLAQNSFQVYTNPSYTRKCKGTSVTLRALGAQSYVWSPATGLNTTTGDSIIASPLVTTTYMVVGTSVSSQTDTTYVTVEIQDSASISHTQPLVFCEGDSVVLQSNVSYGNLWNTGALTSTLTVKTTGIWILATDNECGVTYDTITTINQTPVLTSTQSNVTCYGGSDGSIMVSVASDTIAAPATPGLLISELFTDPFGSDSPFEWVELVATDYLNFSQTPYTVIVSNNGPGSTKGWVQGGVSSVISNSTYAFQISTGTASPGDVLYVGGSSMAPTGTKARVINTATTAGDEGIGAITTVASGVLGNGGIADGIAVFKGSASSLDSNSVPSDAIFFGNSLNNVSLADTSKGFTLPSNDRYAGGHLKTSSYLAPNLSTVGQFLRAIGTYNRTTGVYTTSRSWSIVSSFTNASSAVNVSSNIIYNWSNGSPSKSISNLIAGTYTVTVTSAIGCTKVQSYTVTQPTAIAISFAMQNANCFGGNDGAIDALISGGVPPYSFLWSNGSTAPSINGLSAGAYILTLTDASNCTASSTVTIGQPPAILISSFNPGVGNTGTSVTINGSGFTSVNAVYFDTTASTSFTIYGDTQVVAIVPPFASTGPIKLVNPSGCYGLSTTPFQYVAVFANLQVKFFIEGLYVGSGLMNPVLGNAGIGNFLDVDTVTVFLAQGINPFNIVHSQQAVVNAYGNAVFNFPGTIIGQSFYIVIRQRNSIETWSKLPVLLQQQTIYDFTQ